MKLIDIDKYNLEKQKKIINSYKSHLKWGNCYSIKYIKA